MSIERRAQRSWTLADWLGFSFPIATTVVVFAIATAVFQPPDTSTMRAHRWDRGMEALARPGANPQAGSRMNSAPNGPSLRDAGGVNRSPSGERPTLTRPVPRGRAPAYGAEAEAAPSPEEAEGPSNQDAPPQFRGAAAQAVGEALSRVHAMAPFGVGNIQEAEAQVEATNPPPEEIALPAPDQSPQAARDSGDQGPDPEDDASETVGAAGAPATAQGE